MKKRLTAFITLIVLCVMMLPMSALAEETEPITGECGDLSWEIYSGTLTISGSGEMSDFDSEGAAPWYEYKDSISSLIISDGVTSIGEFAFSGCSNITSIRFCGAQPDSIGSNAFEGITADVLYHHDYSFTSDNYGGDLTYVKTCNGSSYEEVEDEAAEPTCTDAGHEAGTYCSVCKETLSGRETIDAKGHDLIHHSGKAPTYTEAGWEAYDTCSRCEYTTYKEIDKLKIQIGWNIIDGSRYYILSNGAFASGWLKIDNEWYYFNTSNNRLFANGWIKDSTGWMWIDSSGKVTKDRWIQSGGEWYYLKSNGYMAANEWALDRTGWMYMNSSGKITKDKWIKYNGEWYYLKANGYMAANEWAKDSTNWYYMDKHGCIFKNGWAKDSTGWMWMDSSGKITKSKWIQSDGKWCYLKPNGYMAADEWAKDSKNWWYLKPDGSMDANVEPVLQKAAAYVDSVTTPSMTKSEKLRACFDSFRKLREKNPWIPHYTGMDWPQKYANNLFDTKSGNCLSYAAAFAYMAKVLGYKNVYGCNSGGHGWVEIDGLIYDPEWTLHRPGNYYGRSYNESGGPGYKNVALKTGPAWRYIKIS